MRIPALSLMIFLLLALAGLTRAAEIDPCQAASATPGERNQCSLARYQQADRALNEAYKQVMTHLNAGEKQKLREAQRLWIDFRDANCEARAQPAVDKAFYPSVKHDCLREMTQYRSRELTRVFLDSTADVRPGRALADDLIGSWHSTEGDYGMELRFGVNEGVHHYLAQLNGVPYEAGQWRLENDQLVITGNDGGLLHHYPQVKIQNGILTLFEQDGGMATYRKAKSKNAK